MLTNHLNYINVNPERFALPLEHQEVRWYAAQTCARHEKRVREQMEERAVESFLPLYATVSQWKDRKVRVDLPLFPGYLFVRMALTERLRVLQIPSVVRLVGFGELATAMPDDEIESLRQGLAGGLKAEPHPYLKVGRRARVKSGPLQGMEGILVKKKNRERFVISLDLIQRSVAVEMDALELEPAITAKSAIIFQQKDRDIFSRYVANKGL